MDSAPSSSAGRIRSRNKSLGFIANAKKNKHSFIQFFAMTGILLLSVRSLGQKYRLHDLEEDTLALREEKKNLNNRLANIKRGLLDEAALDSSGLFASRLRTLFADHEPGNWPFAPTVSLLSLACTDMIFQVDHWSSMNRQMGKSLKVDSMPRASLHSAVVTCLLV
ncbi:hypothetical protein RJ641_028798 [Dillenia turbinata]|uniref:Uncharacterized protein n=1 Tax=Dillenia turbinata TaxID=194707 RepID=A0AAN8W4Z3_9MAGN